MTRLGVTSILLVLTGTATAADPPAARRGYSDPLLMLDTPGRTGACDVLTFTRDGRQLLAVGDDKVVRTWDWADGRLAPRDPLRWAVWRERRGTVYALALSPDPGQRYAAVAGLGVADGAVAVIDRVTGRVIHGTTGQGAGENRIQTTVWSLAYDPAGERIAIGTDEGEVWEWRPSGGPAALTRIGRHGGKDRVILVWYDAGGRLLSLARTGPAVWWVGGTGTEQRLFTIEPRDRAVVSRDGRRVVAVGQVTGKNPEVAPLAGGLRYVLPLPEGAFADCAALTDDGSRVAVGVKTVSVDAPAYRFSDPKMLIYDIAATGVAGPYAGPQLTNFVEQLAFSPDGRYLAAAGGDDFDLSVFDLRAGVDRPVATTAGPGTGIWGVGLSADGKRLGWQTARNPNPRGPNDGGAGPWKVFDLSRRRPAPTDGFAPVAPIASAGGWSVVEVKDGSQFVWLAVGPGGVRHRLTLSPEMDERPRCYTFLPQSEGKPARVVVGHYWGWSLFELDANGAKRVRIGSGHQGPVIAVAPSADGKLLVTASRDQTVAGWSLADWPSHPHFGAKFGVRLNQLLVDAIDPGSPAWEAGLTRGDRVEFLAVDAGAVIYDPKGEYKGSEVTADPAAVLPNLNAAVPQKELFFRVRRDGQKELLQLSTMLRQRPVWCFFPTKDGEWVMWQPADSLYDASVRGDSFVGWQVSGKVDQTPAFHRARDSDGFGRLYRPDRLARTIREQAVSPERVLIPYADPPEPNLTVADREPTAGAKVTVAAVPRGDREVHRPERAVLWIGDHRYREWEWKMPPAAFRETVAIPPGELRHGTNRLTLQVFGRGGGVEKRQVTVEKGGPAPVRRLFVLLVGVSNYSRTLPPAGETRTPWRNLPGVGVDLARLRIKVPDWAGRAFAEVKVTHLQNDQADPAAVLAELGKLKDRAGPDDVLLLYLGGHGYCEQGGANRGTFTFVGPRFDFRRPAETGLTTDALYRGLTRVKAAKVVLLMACHAGDATEAGLSDPVRELTPGGVGPVVLAACQPTESALVDPVDGSLFAQALMAAVRNRQGTGRGLTVLDLAREVEAGVPSYLKALQDADRNEPDPARRRFEAKDLTLTQTPRLYSPGNDWAAALMLFRP